MQFPCIQVFALSRAKWHVQGLSATREKVRPMQMHFPLCSIVVRRCGSLEEEVDSARGSIALRPSVSFDYELHIQQV